MLLLVVAALLAAGCSGSDKPVDKAAAEQPPPETTTTTVAPTTTTTTRPPTYPLTGLPAPDAATAARAAVAVKIDNVAEARPQAGIRAADVVYEEFTEGVTRFIAVYHSNDAEVVGPVRSVRPADPVIVTPLGGVLGFSGGSPGAEALARNAPLTVVTEGDTAVMYRRAGRAAPHNLYTSTAGLWSRAPAGVGSPRPFADFLPPGGSFTGPGAMPVSALHLVPADHVVADWSWDASAGAWMRSTDGGRHLTEEGPIAPTTVIVQFTPYQFFVDDYSVIYPEVVGSGEVWVFAAGSLVLGTWSKASADAVTTFTDSKGAPILLPPGQTWVHLVAPGSSVTTG
ncbi:MAG: hypothetical protein AVDCRST_MAG10-3276 [uncultured Acidimicrobiales bacterium]|uniref:DUF3048 domain-containing protein n=1 Tax=uncultured Acidimicrobiales bacterium TaxID=310071 RepID=A0A6J4J6S4_9ACTN|nr:MAG: hypothetical protein AVDCRST_MAG10-3276 [uncultured Acidimicrobiales bacterium]